MDKICDYCSAQYDDSLDNCPHCGAANSFVRRSDGAPRTVEELKKWYAEKNLPPESITRFFIGSDNKSARAFGIFRDADGDFVVYKNKADGTRAIRYKGGDESYAVNELYTKLKEYIVQNKANTGSFSSPSVPNSRPRSSSNGKKPSRKTLLIFIIIGIFLLIALFGGNKKSGSGHSQNPGYSYGDYGNNYYYGYGSNSYGNDYNYDYGNDYNYNYDYNDNNDSWDWDSNDDWDDDYDWDSGDSWDWGGDWDSDW